MLAHRADGAAEDLLPQVDRGIVHRLEVPVDDGKRRADLVGGIGDEVAPDLLGLELGGDVLHQDPRSRRRSSGTEGEGLGLDEDGEVAETVLLPVADARVR